VGVVVKKSKRKVVVLTTLVAILTFTSALLLALAPPPINSENFNSLSASDHGEFLDEVFKTAVPTRADQWRYIYIHQSSTDTGNAQTLAGPTGDFCDHFVIGNGQGCQDGEIEISPRWNQQQSASTPPGVAHIEPDCISICLVGDFDHSMPTPMQLRRLGELVTTLQSQLRIPGQRVIFLTQANTPSGAGRYFPVTAFRDQILP
jgi:hypothetical protein